MFIYYSKDRGRLRIHNIQYNYLSYNIGQSTKPARALRHAWPIAFNQRQQNLPISCLFGGDTYSACFITQLVFNLHEKMRSVHLLLYIIKLWQKFKKNQCID